MKITQLHIENFRSIKTLDLALDDTTVFIGPNNAGKTAILEAVRIVLSRRWGQQGTGFTEDYFREAGREDERAKARDFLAVSAPFVTIGIPPEK